MKQHQLGLAVLVAVATVGVAQAARAPLPNYTAASERTPVVRKAARTVPLQARAHSLPSRGGFPSQVDAQLGVPTFLWAKAGGSAAGGQGPLKLAQLAEARARAHLSAHAGELKLRATDTRAARLTELQENGRGPVIARFQQMHQGREVFGRRLAVAMDSALEPVAISGYFAPVPPSAKAARFEQVDAVGAIRKAFRDLTGVDAAIPLQAVRTKGAYTHFAAGRQTSEMRLQGESRVKPVFFPLAGELVPAQLVTVSAQAFDGGPRSDYAYVISSLDGRVLFRKNLAAHAAFSYRVYADTSAPNQPFDGPFGNARTAPLAVADPNVEPARTPALANLVTLEKGPIAGNDPWLPDGATQTNGNNVDAYLDLGPTDGLDTGEGDFRAAATGASTFDYTATPDADPVTDTQASAAIVNLFYVNNWLHDFWYANGFDEAAGNAQEDNFGRGGEDGDPIHAEVDATDFDNANMNTPPDGGSPRQQMYLFSGPSEILVEETAPVARTFGSPGPAQFGPQAFDLTGTAVLYDDGVAAATNACEPAVNAAALAGNIAVVDRGGCTFVVKAANAEAAGAVAIVVLNINPGEGTFTMAGTGPAIPGLMLSQEDGVVLKGDLAGAVTLHMLRSADPPRDSALDNGIVAHEWFHYVSNRLVGDALGLSNNQGNAMGEGWADFASLMLVVRPEDNLVAGNDAFQGAYSQSTYVDTIAYFGGRRTPYSTDMAINPLTFIHTENGVPLPNTAPLQFGASGLNNAEVHNSGEIWANALWEVYAALLNDPRYTFAQAQDRMKTYVISGLKLTPDAPTFLEARNAFLAAVAATDGGADLELAQDAFAKRGMGAGATSANRYDDFHQGVRESFVARAAAFSVTSAEVDLSFDDGERGFCDTDTGLDTGETGLLRITVRSDGNQPITAPFTVELDAPDGVRFPAGNTVTFQPLGVGNEATGGVLVRLAGDPGPDTLAISLTFPDSGAGADAVIEPLALDVAQDVDFDLVPARTLEDVESPLAALNDWQRSANVTDLPDAFTWQIDGNDFFGTGLMWYVPDNGFAGQLSLTSPPIQAGNGFRMSFDHFFQFEPDGDFGGTLFGFDGGVIDISVDGGPFEDVFEFGATVTAGNGYNGMVEALISDANPDGLPGFVDTNGDIESVTLDFGDLAAGSEVRIRFRMNTDPAVADFGWLLDNIGFEGITGQPFSDVVSDTGPCANRPPHADAGPDFARAERKSSSAAQAVIGLKGSARDRDGSAGLTFAWSQVGGPAAALGNANSANATFTAPGINADTPLTFRLTVSDGVAPPSTDDVVVTLTNVAEPAVDGGGGALGHCFVVIGLVAALRRKRACAAR